MTSPAYASTIDLDAIRSDLRLGAPDASLRPIGLQHLVLGEGALDALPGLVQQLGRPGPVVVLMDTTPMRHGQRDLKLEVVSMLAVRAGMAGPDIQQAVLGAPGRELHADPAAVAAATEMIRGAGCVVALGSGTICDIAKEASRHGDVPLIVVQTACSVNAFSDDMAVLLLHGVKRTVPSRWPDALVIDLSVIADAPPALNRAGVGELMAMFTAPADWYLASAIGMDETYDSRVVDLFRSRGDRLREVGPGLATSEPDALLATCELMTLSGLALGVAGRTAPISGTEHTVSHLLDMAASKSGRSTGLHGAQVGVAAVPVAVAWADLLAEIEPERLLAGSGQDEAVLHDRTVRAFAPLDPSGEMAAECWREVRHKLQRYKALGPRLERFVSDWDDHRRNIEGLLGSAHLIAATLRMAGAPVVFSDLEPSADETTARWALWNGHLLRDRFSLADLAWFAGAWSEETAGGAVEQAAAIAGSL